MKHLVKAGTPGYEGNPAIKFDVSRARAEILTLKATAQQVAIMCAIEMGRRLEVAKEALPHGEWLQFLNDVEMGERSARRCMAIASELGTVAGIEALPIRRADRVLELFHGGEIEEIKADGTVVLDGGEVVELKALGSLDGKQFDEFVDKLTNKLITDQKAVKKAEKDLTTVRESHKREMERLRAISSEQALRIKALTGDATPNERVELLKEQMALSIKSLSAAISHIPEATDETIIEMFAEINKYWERVENIHAVIYREWRTRKNKKDAELDKTA